ncbi:MBL fold metallo-hydrolase [Cuneatibacter sp. NSJ-177]|uniref:MBL fold metallo-hydrolase n=1 Tax=Cuneatibacter sp. NSJ-177 TaxID=2931401 RepID=UPI001FD12638|nr:MBL fold metallo-hydrolase [Cuneatibacter sp. NSJ-177]MCJ7834487.1 MBL fold metallo-hydrolase [Cuneatibacter sp. NSJ-177]
MSKTVTLTWRGHSCFKLEQDGFSIVVDPYKDGKVPGLADLRDTANRIICSHNHDDHGYVDAITYEETDKENPFQITMVACPHDDEGGAKRGMNMIHVFDNGELRIAHFGDIGCPLNEKQKETLGRLDVVMVPVGGFYTMEPDGIEAMLEELNPAVVIPMHYRTEEYGFPVIGTLEDFLKFRSDVVRYETNTLDLTPDMKKQTAVLKYLG